MFMCIVKQHVDMILVCITMLLLTGEVVCIMNYKHFLKMLVRNLHDFLKE